jgi:hypothetical protein
LLGTRNSGMMDAHDASRGDRVVDDQPGAMEGRATEARSMGATLTSMEQYDFRVPLQTPASVMYAEFQRDPLLPGGIVADGETVVGLLSRQRFFQQLSHRYGASLFLDAPVQKILGTGPSCRPFRPTSKRPAVAAFFSCGPSWTTSSITRSATPWCWSNAAHATTDTLA